MTAVAPMLGSGSIEAIRTWVLRQQIDARDRPGLTTDAALQIKPFKAESAKPQWANET